MIYVYVKNDLKPFEADIRDLCMAFFPMQKFTYVYDDKAAILDGFVKFIKDDAKCEIKNNIIVKDYFSGDINKDRELIIDNIYEKLGKNLSQEQVDRIIRIKLKSDIKRQLYKFLSELTGKNLLWGTLTGIRPVTIVTNFLEAYIKKDVLIQGNQNAISKNNINKDDIIKDVYGLDYIEYNGDVRKFLKEEFYLSDIKIDELIEIAKKEIEILNRSEIKGYKDSYSFYVGIPFCKSTCLYCSFTSFNIEKYSDYVDKYLTALEYEFQKELHWDRFAPSDKNGNKRCYSPMTLYIGGGTPTSLTDDDFERLLTIIDKYIYKKVLIEYTVEAGRPDTITEKKLMSMKNHGVTRISINPQTFNQKTLDLIGRKHKVSDVIEKFKLARKMGFDNINMDIILGLPNEKIFDVIKTLCNVWKLKPDSFTVHSLALKRAARLNVELETFTKNYYLAGLDTDKNVMNKMFSLCEKLARLIGLKPYYLYRQKNMAGNLENVGYTKDKKECLYNIMMMSERHTVFGFGCATTKEVIYENDNKRVESIEGYKSVIDYCKMYESK